jgi:type IV pilus assembly protein PilF
MRIFALSLAAILMGCAAQSAPRHSSVPARTASTVDSVASERAKIHTELGVNYYQNGQLGVALEELNTATKADRSYAPAYGALALVYMELREDEQAEANFRQALKLNPNGSETKNNYGLFLCQRGKEQEGLRQLLDALKDPLYQTPDVAYKNAGMCARKAGDMKGAESYLLRAVKLNPRQAQALYGLAEVNFARDDYAAAKQYLSRYAGLMENAGPEALWLGARIEHRLGARGDRTALANYGMQLRRRYPSSPEAKAYQDGRFE